MTIGDWTHKNDDIDKTKVGRKNNLDVGIQGHDGGEVHRGHVVGVATQDAVHNEAECPLRWVKSVPKGIDISVWAEVW